MSSPVSKKFEELVDQIRVWVGYGLKVAIPGRVLSYDKEKQVADIQIVVRDTRRDEEGREVQFSPPPLRNVPVMAVSGGGYFVHFPIAVGDMVELWFQDRSLDRWKSLGQGGREIDPVDVRRHDINDAVALPGLRPISAPLSGMRDDAMTLGKVGGLQIHVEANAIRLGDGVTTDGVAMDSKVRTELDRLWNAVQSHTHAVSTTGSASAQSGTAAASGGSSTSNSVGSSSVKVKD